MKFKTSTGSRKSLKPLLGMLSFQFRYAPCSFASASVNATAEPLSGSTSKPLTVRNAFAEPNSCLLLSFGEHAQAAGQKDSRENSGPCAIMQWLWR